MFQGPMALKALYYYFNKKDSFEETTKETTKLRNQIVGMLSVDTIFIIKKLIEEKNSNNTNLLLSLIAHHLLGILTGFINFKKK